MVKWTAPIRVSGSITVPPSREGFSRALLRCRRRRALLRKQTLDERRHFLLQLRVELAARLAGEAGVRAPDPAIASEKEGRRERVQVDALRHLVVQLFRLARNQ